MLLVRTKLGLSKIHGIGLFADEFIPAGKPIWQFAPKLDQVIPKNEFNALPEIAKSQILKYSYRSGDKYVLCFDDARFFNHSPTPSMVDGKELADPVVAARDIQVGEEITSDYWAFDDDAATKLA